jgi:murein DD-endopeptidase MepM/ murein hydrolase activator NlpD
VQSVLPTSVANGDREGVRLTRSRVLAGAGLAGFALVAITAAAALPSVAPASRASASRLIDPQLMHRAAVEQTVAPSNAAESDPAARRFTGRVGTDLSQSLASAGVPEGQGREYVALLARAIPLANGLSVEDRFDIVLERNPDGSLGQLLYAGMDRVARADIELMKWTDGKQIIWVNADGVGGDGSGQGIRMPVQGHLTSGFGERFHPILGYERFHAGVDLGAPAGTPIVAAADGRVVSAGWAGGYGRLVAVLHTGGIETKYGHMSRIAAYAGETVRRGEVIGYVGSSGLSTGPHLHFEVTRNGRPVNPLSIKAIGGAPPALEGEKLLAFHNELRKILLGAS